MQQAYKQALSYWESGEFEKAKSAFRSLVQEDPKNSDLRNDLGAVLFHLGEFAESEKELYHALSLAPNDPNIIANLFEVITISEGPNSERLLPLLDRLKSEIAIVDSLLERLAEVQSPTNATRVVTTDPRLISLILSPTASYQPVSYNHELFSTSVPSNSRSLRSRVFSASEQYLRIAIENSKSEFIAIVERGELSDWALKASIKTLTMHGEICGILPAHSNFGVFRRNDLVNPSGIPEGIQSIEQVINYLSKRGKKVVKDLQLESHPNEAQSEYKLLLLYDEKGWAWWHRSHHIKRTIGSACTVDIKQFEDSFNHQDYDFVLPFDHNILPLIPSLRGIRPEQLIIGNSCPIFIEEAAETRVNLGAIAGITNNLSAWKKVRADKNWFCCPNGVDTKLFHPSGRLLPERHACWIGNSNSVGRKGLDLVRAACERAGYKLVMKDGKAGNWQTQEQMRDELYYGSSVYICASEYEGTPNPALEALACGIPVITTDVGNMPELILDGYNGWIVERSIEGLTNALLEHSKSDIQQLGRNARSSIEEGWSWEAQAPRYLEVLRTIKAT